MPATRTTARRGSPQVRLRIGLILIAMVLSFFGARLVQLQGIDPKSYAAMAAAEGIVEVTLPAERGDILDRNGVALADSIQGKMVVADPLMTADEIRARTQAVWDRFYSLRRVWVRSRCTPTLRARLAFVLISKLYRQMYANTGIATDSARVSRANRWARFIARPCRRLRAAAAEAVRRRRCAAP